MMLRVTIDQPAPDFSLPDFSGNPFHLAGLHGKKNILLVFNRAELLALNDVRHLSPVIVITQSPAVTVEVAKEVHPAEKALVFEKPPDKKN